MMSHLLSLFTQYVLLPHFFQLYVSSLVSRSQPANEDLDSKPDAKKVRGGVAAKKVLALCFAFQRKNF